MRTALAALAFAAFALSACALAERLRGGGGETLDTATLTPADPATDLIAGGALTMTLSAPRELPPPGQDPVLTLRLARSDGRAMSFQSANHAPMDVMAQAPGGPLAQAMGYFGDEAPSLYNALPASEEGAAFICPPSGPLAIGVHADADGGVAMIGLRGAFVFETMEDGTTVAAPVSPDIVCARMRFTRS